MKISKILISILVPLLIAVFIAQANATTEPVIGQSKSSQLSNQFDSIISKLTATNSHNGDALQNIIEQLAKLQNQATDCVNNSKTNLDAMNEKLKNYFVLQNSTTSTTAVDLIYLRKKQLELTSQLADCRLIVLRSQEAIETYQRIIQQDKAQKLLAPTPPIWQNLKNSVSDSQTFFSHFNTALFLKRLGLPLSSMAAMTMLLIYLAVSFIIGILIREQLIQPVLKFKKLPKLLLIVLVVLKHFLPLLCISGLLCILLTVMDWSSITLSYLTQISYAFFALLLFIVIITIIFHPPSLIQGFTKLPRDITQVFRRRLSYFGIICFLAYTIYVLFHEQAVPASIIHLSSSLLITILGVNLISILWLIKKTPKISFHYRILNTISNIILSILLIGILLTEWLGHSPLAIFLVTRIALTLLFFFLAWIITKILISLINSFEHIEQNWQQKFRYHIGVKPYHSIPELWFLRIFVYLLISGAFALTLLTTWGLTTFYFKKVLAALLQGFTVVKITIIPLRILIALFIFSLLMLLVRWLRSYLTHHSRYYTGAEAQVAFASLVGYCGFAIVTFIALIVAGVNFTGLAIIAGALSFGIGFGLQNIVNNFVSGIVLLLEKPIRSGDRISIGNTEGFVKKIRIRSTQITTMSRTDVIVPNSELISQQVTNFMFRDKNFRVTCDVQVTYGSNVELIKKILLDIAFNHPNVLKEPPNEPEVLFKAFADNGLNFSLLCIIENVNKKFTVQSDINFAIAKKFQENHIAISSPQREIYIKELPKSLLKDKEIDHDS